MNISISIGNKEVPVPVPPGAAAYVVNVDEAKGHATVTFGFMTKGENGAHALARLHKTQPDVGYWMPTTAYPQGFKSKFMYEKPKKLTVRFKATDAGWVPETDALGKLLDDLARTPEAIHSQGAETLKDLIPAGS